MLHLGIIAQFSISYEYMQCQLYIVCILCYIIPYIVIVLEWAAENFNFCTFELLDIFGEHGPSVRGITSFVFFSDLFLDESVLIVRVLHSIHSLSLLELYHMVGHVPYISVPNNSFYRRMEY